MTHLRFWMLAVAVCAPALAAAQQVDPEASFNAGLNHLREGRPAMAVEAFRKAVKEDGKNPYFQKGLGQAYLATGKYDDAVSAFRKALELNQYYVDVRNDLGTALVLSGRRNEGKNEFLTAFNDPTNPTPEISSRNLGNAYLEEKHYEEAVNWYRTSLNRNHSYPDAYLGLSDALFASGRIDDAVTTLESGAKECPQSAIVLLTLGEAYSRVGRLAEARSRLEEARKKDPIGPAGRRAAQLLQQFPSK
ncbi:MAG TPA: tetratricopeptide repeat protein [Vicinamibacteria bacterium]|nr:tetratricopeptide repeat protein [Vicinamibacteria bacterium]